MTLLNDWKFWLVILNFIVILFNIGIYTTIKFNDLKHLAKDSEIVKKSLEKIFKRLGRMERTQVAITTRCEERHKKK